MEYSETRKFIPQISAYLQSIGPRSECATYFSKAGLKGLPKLPMSIGMIPSRKQIERLPGNTEITKNILPGDFTESLRIFSNLQKITEQKELRTAHASP